MLQNNPTGPGHNPGIVNESNQPALSALYVLVFLGTIGFLINTYIFDFDNYSEMELVKLSYLFIPALIFSIIGFATRKSSKSLLYAIGLAALSLGPLLVFFQGIWLSL